MDDGTKTVRHKPVQHMGQTIIDPSHQEEDHVLIFSTTTVDIPNSEEKPNKTLEHEKQVTFSPEIEVITYPTTPKVSSSEA
eukprot:14388841-Ditylum_brightwellii.AAC.1